MIENVGIIGTIKIYEGSKLVYEKKNKLMDNARVDIFDFLIGNVPTTTGINYLAVGSGANSNGVQDTDTTLENEFFRKQISKTYKVGAKRFVAECYIEPSEANEFTWSELALFINGDATSNSGRMYNKAKIDGTNIKNSSTGRTIMWEVRIP